MDDMSPAEALGQVRAARQSVIATRRVPLWYFPGMVVAIATVDIGLDSDNTTVNVASVVLGLLIAGAVMTAFVVWHRVRRTPIAWRPVSVSVAVGWLLATALLARVAHALFVTWDLPAPKVLAALMAIAVLLASTRPMENLILKFSRPGQ